METNDASQKQAVSSKNKVIIIAAMLIVAAIIIAGVIIGVMVRGQSAGDSDNGGLTIGYATDASVLLDEDALQAAMDEARRNAANSNVALRYQNDAMSTDGVTFGCYIANSQRNLYDMFLAIYTDAELTDQVFLSGLVRPGSGFEEITLEHALDIGDHVMYVVVTLVDTEEDGTQSVKAQVTHTMDFHVVEE